MSGLLVSVEKLKEKLTNRYMSFPATGITFRGKHDNILQKHPPSPSNQHLSSQKSGNYPRSQDTVEERMGEGVTCRMGKLFTPVDSTRIRMTDGGLHLVSSSLSLLSSSYRVHTAYSVHKKG